jgi:hypothetical protein
MMGIKLFIFCITLYLLPGDLYCQHDKVYNLYDLAKKKQLNAVDRTVQPFEEGVYRGIRVSEDTSEGLVWIKDVYFSSGEIEFDVRGKNEFQKSFTGIAFHGQRDGSFDAVYFRPFNFHAVDSVRHIHAVQYISHPVYTWKKLREEKNAQYEKAVPGAPDPNGWFHVRVTIKDRNVKVYINHRTTPELVVRQLSNFAGGNIGLFTGDGSGGDFANFIINKE